MTTSDDDRSTLLVPSGPTLLDYTTGAITEILRFLQATIEEMQTVRLLPQLGHAIPLEQLYIPVKVSQKRLRNLAEDRAAEGRRLRGEHEEQRAFATRGEEDFLRSAKEREEIVLQWERARQQFLKAVILGDPGQGKTTLLRWEAWKVATESLTKLQTNEASPSTVEIPLFVRLAEVAVSGKSLLDFVRERLRSQGYSDRFLQWLTTAISRGQVVFLLDALDEVQDHTWRQSLNDTFNVLLSNVDTAQCRYLLSTRIVGYDGCAVEQRGKALELVAFGPKESERFAHAWFGDDETSQQGFLHAIRTNPSLQGLTGNPLLLALLCTVYRQNGDYQTAR